MEAIMRRFLQDTYSGHSNNSVGNLFTQISFCNFLHLDEDHGWDFFSRKGFFSLRRFNLHMRFSLFVDNLEREVFQIVLNCLVRPFPSYQSLGIKDCVLGVCGELIFSCISNETFSFCCECDIGWGDTVTLVVCNNFNTAVFEDSDAIRKETQDL